MFSIKFALKWAWNKGFRQIMLETNSKLAHQILLSPSTRQGHQQSLIHSIVTLLNRGDWQVQLTHIFREANSSVDWLAKRGLEINSSFQDFSFCIPKALSSFLYYDFRAIPPPSFKSFNNNFNPASIDRGQSC